MQKGDGKNQHYANRSGRAKKQFATADEAIEEAKRLNETKDSYYKYVAYKCGVCHKYHVGKSAHKKRKR